MERTVAQPPPRIPTTIGVVMRVTTPVPTLDDLERALEREERNLDARQRERADALQRVESLDRQIVNVQLSIDDLTERIQARSAIERVEFLEGEVKRLKTEVSELRNPRSGREFS